MNKKILLWFSSLLPILVLLGWVGLNEVGLRSGEEYVLPITGYDPRDLLSGHYLRYRIQYSAEEGDCPFNCPFKGDCSFNSEVQACLCMQAANSVPQLFVGRICSIECKGFIKGRCEYGRFVADVKIERYYIPEKDAQWLDKMLREGERKAEIVVVISTNGDIYLKDLRFDGKSWREYKP